MPYRQDPTDEEFIALNELAGSFAGKRVLEVGCGNGRITRKFAHLAAYVDAIDPDADKITQARQRPHPDHVHYHPVALAEFAPKERYDLAILSWSL